jgi:hypothetical protein
VGPYGIAVDSTTSTLVWTDQVGASGAPGSVSAVSTTRF